MAEELILGLFQCRVHGFGVRGLAELLQKGGAVREQAETGEDVQVKGVIRAADHEEEVCAFTILRAEEDGADGTAEREEGLLEEIGVVVAGM